MGCCDTRKKKGDKSGCHILTIQWVTLASTGPQNFDMDRDCLHIYVVPISREAQTSFVVDQLCMLLSGAQQIV